MSVKPLPVLILAVLAVFPQSITGHIYSTGAAHLAGALSLSVDEASWFQTLYMIGQLMTLPLAAWLAYRLGNHGLLRLGAGIGLAATLISSLWMSPTPQMAAWAAHGVSASLLLVFAHRIVLTQLGFRAIAFVEGVLLLGLVLIPMSLYPYTLAHLAENDQWHWSFAVQVAPFLAMLYWAYWGRWTWPDPSQRIAFNWPQAILLSAFIGGATYLLLRGERFNWFRDPHIVALTLATLVLGVVSAIAMRHRWGQGEYLCASVLGDPHGKVAMLDAAVAGFVILGITLLISYFVASVMQYSHAHLGMLEMISFPGMLAGLAIALFFTSHHERNPEKIIPLGVAVMMIALYLLTQVNADSGAPDLTLALVLKGLAIALLNITLTIHILRSFPKHRAAEGIAWFYLFRNFGSLVATALFSRLLTLDTHNALSKLGENFNEASETFGYYQQEAAAALQQATGTAAPERVAALLSGHLKNQAMSVAGVNGFQWLIFSMLILIPFMVLGMRWASRHSHS